MNINEVKKPDTGEEQLEACTQGIKKVLSDANLWAGDFYEVDTFIKEAEEFELKITKTSIYLKVSNSKKILTYDFKR